MRTYGPTYRPTNEDVTRCVSWVDDPHSWGTKQCARKRGHGQDGLFCKQHAKWHPARNDQP